MKITNDMKDTMQVLAEEFAFRTALGSRKPQAMGRQWNDNLYPDRSRWSRGGWEDPAMHTLGLTFTEMVDALGAETSSGANTQAVIFAGQGVVKWSKQDGIASHYETDEDARWYQKIASEYPQYTEFLAETVQVGRFTVQEDIVNASDVIDDLTDDERFDVYVTLIQVVFDLGLRDVHMGNWGFRGKDRTTPVIYDFSDRSTMQGYATYDRMNFQFEWNNWSDHYAYEEELERIWDNLADGRSDY